MTESLSSFDWALGVQQGEKSDWEQLVFSSLRGLFTYMIVLPLFDNLHHSGATVPPPV